MFATFIFVLFYRYDGVTAFLWIRYPGILLGEGYNWYLYTYRLFCDYEMQTIITSNNLNDDVVDLDELFWVAEVVIFVNRSWLELVGPDNLPDPRARAQNTPL
jgi:hypothetical protein